MSVLPPFSLDKPRYDQSQYSGRLNHILSILDPMKLLIGESELQSHLTLLDKFKANGCKHPPGVTDAQLWRAREVKECLVHPDTGKPVPKLFNFAAYVPMQPPIVIGLCWPGAGTATTLFWQWYNQSYNVAVNYCNRNEAGSLTNEKLAQAYMVACGTACGIAIGMGKLSAKLKNPALALFAPFTSVCAAGCASLIMIRYQELVTGVPVKDTDGKEVGFSQNAAQEGLAKCCVPRVLWNIPNLLVPPVVMARMDAPTFKKYPAARLPFFTVLATCCCAIGVYPTQAIFSQTATIPSSRLEPRFQGLKDAAGKEVTEFTYNKGL